MSEIEYAFKVTPDTLCYQASCAENDHEAHAILLKAIAMDPNHVQTNYNLALFYNKWGNDKQAMVHFQNTRSYQDSLYYIGKLYMSDGYNTLALTTWEEGCENGSKKCNRELMEYYFSLFEFDDPKSTERFDQFINTGYNQDPDTLSRYNYMVGVYYLIHKDNKSALDYLTMTEDSDGKFLIWKHSLDSPDKNNLWRYEAAMGGHPEAMFEEGKWMIETRGDFKTAVKFIIDSKFNGYLDYLFEVYKSRLETKLVSLKPIKNVLSYDRLKILAEIGEKTNLKRGANSDPSFLEECADYHLTGSKVRILINKMYSGNNTTQQLKKMFQDLRRFAEEGNLDAKLQVAKCYNTGKGVKMDRKEAEAWYRNAAQIGCRQAQHHLAWWLRSGDEATMNQLKESKMWTEKCLELREGETEVPDKERYLKILKKVDSMIGELKENEQEHKALILFKGPRREGRDEFLFQAAELFDRAVDGGPDLTDPDPEAAMLVGMVFGMTGMKDKNREWFDKALQKKEDPKATKKDDFPLTGPPMAGRTTSVGQRYGELESFPTKITPQDSQFRPIGQGIRTREMEKDSYPKAEKLEEDEDEEFIDIASGLDNLD